VRNHQAKLNMMAMKTGDLGFFYHSGAAREIVGIVEVIGEYKPDPTDETGKFGLVDVKAVRDLPKPVTIAQAKADPKLKDMTLVTFSRLSVQPVTPEQWKQVLKLGGAK
jgi:predicted RNA-binding protein with PUA-like domain